ARAREGVGAMFCDRRHQGALVRREPLTSARTEDRDAENSVVANERQHRIRLERLTSPEGGAQRRIIALDVLFRFGPTRLSSSSRTRCGHVGVEPHALISVDARLRDSLRIEEPK